jgi:hypothetical protein
VEDLSPIEKEELVGGEKSIEQQNAERDIRVGALWFFGRLVVTIVTYSLASEAKRKHENKYVNRERRMPKLQIRFRT